jgi:hypothetical protein
VDKSEAPTCARLLTTGRRTARSSRRRTRRPGGNEYDVTVALVIGFVLIGLTAVVMLYGVFTEGRR